MRQSDLDYVKYFPIGERDREWGLCISGVGSTHIPPHYASYPPTVHPDRYMLAWERGRTLSEYAAIYVVRGEGRFESRSAGVAEVAAGTVMLLFPDEWHRYRPDKKTGWDEYWVTFGGQYMDDLVRRDFFSPAEPLLRIGVDESVMHIYLELLDRARAASIGFQHQGAADVYQLLAAALTAVRRHAVTTRDEELVRQVKSILEEQVEGTISMPKLARSLHIGEDQLRRIFKRHTGMVPYQYYLELKMHRARQNAFRHQSDVEADCPRAGL